MKIGITCYPTYGGSGAVAMELGLDLARFDDDRAGAPALERIKRDVGSALASGEVQGTPTLFIDGVLHRGDYETDTLVAALS